MSLHHMSKDAVSKFSELLDKGFIFHAFRPAIDSNGIVKIERMINAKLPDQYRDYLLHSNGGVLDKHITEDDDGYAVLVTWPEGSNLFANDKSYHVLNTLFSHRPSVDETESGYSETLLYNYLKWKNTLPSFLLPIGNGPGGDLFLLGFGPENTGKIYFWKLETGSPVHVDEDGEAYSMAYLGFIADSFVEFILALEPVQNVQF